MGVAPLEVVGEGGGGGYGNVKTQISFLFFLSVGRVR